MGPLNVCLAIVRWLPVLFITAVVVWSYYAYVIQMCLFTITNIPQKVLYLILYHPFIIMFSWSYWKVIFTDVAVVPKEFFLSSTDLDQFERTDSEDTQKEILSRIARNLPVQCRTHSGAIRYCDKCKCIKPDRAHHCSVCGMCVLKMDHHCPWVNNCVCFNTYKFFVLFLGYALLYCLYVGATSLQFFIIFWTGSRDKGIGEFHVLFLFFAAMMFAISVTTLFCYHMYLSTVNRSTLGNENVDPRLAFKHDSYVILDIGGDSHDLANLHIVFLFFVAVMFAISLLSLFGYHMFLSCRNRSTLESFRAPIFRSGPDKDGFSLGKMGNFMEIFGDNKKYWFLPMFTSTGDGVTYPTRVTPNSSSYHSMETTNATNTTTNATTNATNANTTQPSNTQLEDLSNKNNSSSNFGDGVTFPIRTIDEDYDSLLGQRQRWMEEGDMDGGGSGYDNAALVASETM